MTDHDRAPRDVVPPAGITHHTLRELDSLAGQTVIVTEPGDLLTDHDGSPLGVGPTTATSATFAGACIHAADLPDALSVAVARKLYPNLSIHDPEENDR